MVPPQRCESEQYEEKEIKSRESTRSKSHEFMRSDKSRESTRSKSHEFMRSDWMTLRGDTLGQVKPSKSFQVPHHRRPEGAAIQQRPGASTSSTLMESPAESQALHSILACFFLWLLFAQAEAPSHIAAMVLAFYAVFPSACTVAAVSLHALWEATKDAGGYLFYDLARPAAVSLLCCMPSVRCNTIGASRVDTPIAAETLTALLATGNTSAIAPVQVKVLCAGSQCEGSPQALWFALHAPSPSPPSALPASANSALSSLSLCACGGEQTPVYITAQMLPREQLVLARNCSYRFTHVQWNRLCRCYWGNTSQDAPLHPGSHLPFSRFYPVVEPLCVSTQEQLRGALLQTGAALVRTGEFLKAVPSAASLPQQAITRSSHATTTGSLRATTTGEVAMPSLEQIRNPNNTSWVAIINDGKSNSGSRLRKTSLTSKDNWQKAGANWLKGALEPTYLNESTYSQGDHTGPRIYQSAGLLRLKGVLRQQWHADAAQANSLTQQDPDEALDEFDALPLSALHPLSPGGSTILIVPSDTRVPSQAFVPTGHVLIWRGDLEHAGDEFLGADNIALFTYIMPPAALFEMERDEDGATLTFGTGRQHSQRHLPVNLRGCDRGAGVGPIGSIATLGRAEDERLSRLSFSLQVTPDAQLTMPLITGDTSQLSGTDAGAEDAPSTTPSITGDTSPLLGTDAGDKNAVADNTALSGTASPHSSPGRVAFSNERLDVISEQLGVCLETVYDAHEQLDAFISGLNAEYGPLPPSPSEVYGPLSPSPLLTLPAPAGLNAEYGLLSPSPSAVSGLHMPSSPLPSSPETESDAHACGGNLTVGNSIYTCGGNMDDSMHSVQMLEQQQMDRLTRGNSFTGTAPNSVQLRPIAESAMDAITSNVLTEEQALNSNGPLEGVPGAALLAEFGNLTSDYPNDSTPHGPHGPPVTGPYANAAGLTHSRGSRSTRVTEFANHKPSDLPLADLISDDCHHLPLADLPLAVASLPGSDALVAANSIVDRADERMNPRVLSLIQDFRDERVQACVDVLTRNETLVLGTSLSGYSQVRVVGPSMQGSIDSQLDEAVRSGRPLRFQAARVLPPLGPNGTRTTVHGQYHHLPELAASELAKPLADTLPAPAPAVSNLSVEAQSALQSAEAEGLTLERNTSATGFCGVVCNANAGKGKIRAKPFQARLYVINSSSNKRARVNRGYFGSAEEAALHYAWLLKHESNSYSASPS